MRLEHSTLSNESGTDLFICKWLPSSDTSIKGVVQIAHGMAEWSGRYESFAESLTNRGYLVYANDHRGHGKTAKSLDLIGYTGTDGFNGMARDLNLITHSIKLENPGLPIFIFGHSMGSFLAQRYISNWGSNLKGVILSGSNGKRGIDLDLGIHIARFQVMIKGAKAKSILLDLLSFGSFNSSFEPTRTKFDWLSRDPDEVDKYIDDPYCGAVFTTSFFYDFFRGIKHLYDTKTIKSIPKGLSVFIFSGEMDPVGELGKGPLKLAQYYRNLGLTDVSLKLYTEGRHEMLHEINHDEVMQDVINWLDAHL